MGIFHNNDIQVVMLDFQDIITDLFGSNVSHVHLSEDEKSTVKKINGEVWVADDSNSSRLIVSELLAKAEIEHKLFNNGKELLESYNSGDSKSVVAIITDFEMPQLDGLELSVRIKKMDPRMPILLLSSLVNSNVVDKSKEAGVDLCLEKDELNSLIKNLIELINKG